MENCRVGTLYFADNSINQLNVSGGEIHSVKCPPANGPNPFTGSVSFKNTRFPISKEESELFPGKQHLHNLRHHLEKLENTFEAQKMRALELAAERKDEVFTNWVLSWYQYISTNYGLSPGRPLLAATALYFSMAFLSFFFGWGVPDARAPTNFYDVGWRIVLKDDFVSCFWLWGTTPSCGNWPRALLLPGQYILNPFGIFGTQSLLVAKTGWLNTLLTFSGLLCDILIATGFLAIRKRFKLN